MVALAVGVGKRPETSEESNVIGVPCILLGEYLAQRKCY